MHGISYGVHCTFDEQTRNEMYIGRFYDVTKPGFSAKMTTIKLTAKLAEFSSGSTEKHFENMDFSSFPT